MKILIDMQPCQSASRYRGVGRYCLELVKSIVAQDDNNDYYIILNETLGFVDEIKAQFADSIGLKNIYSWTQFHNTSSYHGDKGDIFISEVIREAVIRELKADIVFLVNLQEGWEDGAVVSVGRLDGLDSSRLNGSGLPYYISLLHDVIPLIYEDDYLAEGNPIRPWYFEKIDYLSRVDKIVTISQASKADIERIKGYKDIALVPAGINSTVFREVSEKTQISVLEKFHIDKQFLLYTGGMNPHKNLDNLYRAYALLPPEIKDEYKLVLAGKVPHHIEHIKSVLRELKITENVIFTDYISDMELVALYSASSLFVFPSYQEGFGIPPLEAMAAGTVVIASDIPVMKEVIGAEVDAFFSPFDPEDISRKILFALKDTDFRENFKIHALKQIDKYSWENNAGKFISLVNSLSDEINGRVSQSSISSLELAINTIKTSKYPIDDLKMRQIAKLLSENFPPINRKPKIFIDISSMVHNDHKTGIQRVVRALSNELMKIYDNIEFVYSYANHLSFWKAYIEGDSYSVGARKEVVDFYHGDKLLYLDLHPALAISHRNINARLRAMGVEVYYVIYDLIPILKPEAFVKELSQEFGGWATSTSYADGVICISRSVADEYIHWLGAHKPVRSTKLNIGYFHLGADIHNSLPSMGMPKEAPQLLESLKFKLNFIMVGTLEPRKGHLKTIQSFEKLWRDGHDANLFIVGRKGWLSDEITDYIAENEYLDKKLFWFNGVTDEYLEAIYGTSNCLIAASDAEGFGLPLIEAARHNLSIIARDIPVFREVAGDHAYYFSGTTVESQAQEIETWINLWKENNHPRSEGMNYFTWKESAEQFIECLTNKNWYQVYNFSEGMEQ